MNAIAERSKQVFLEIIRHLAADDWPEQLARACGDDDLLRQRVEALLHAHRAAGSFLGADPALGNGSNDLIELQRPILEMPGTCIGPYKLRQEIGEGGFGVVYMAEQQEPVRRMVALKIIKPGMDTREVIARFESERQALALMDHPNIARVLDAGATESGRPYFVMELVRGIPVTEFCGNNQIEIRQRLELFIHVCHAVQHAHQKGIIHRDLKPSNVMVTLHDGRPVPKVIDFGVAKAVSPFPLGEGQGEGVRLTERTLFTAYGQMIGTPAYMSPEQAEMSGLDIDTRSDIYSLGVLLYELLTGTTPFEKKRLRSVNFDELRRIIREEEPETVSARLAKTKRNQSSQDAECMLSRREGTAAKRWSAALPELDWIVAKSLEKDRERRYESAADFARDIDRYLGDEPVQACPSSSFYRFGKFARKHKRTLLTTTAAAAALVIGTAVSLWQAVDANSARQLAQQNLNLAEQRLTAEEQARREAELERERAESEHRRAESERDRAELQARMIEKQRESLENNHRVSMLITNELLGVLRDFSLPVASRRELLNTALERRTNPDPADRAAAFQAAGNLFLAMNENAAAIRAFSEGLAIQPQRAGLLIGRGDVYFRQADFDNAVEDYSAAIKNLRNRDPALGLVPYARRALARCHQEQFDDAIGDFRASYEQSPKETITAIERGFSTYDPFQAPFNERLKSGIVALLDQYIADQKNSLTSLFHVVDLLVELKQFDEARNRLENAAMSAAHLGIFSRLALLAVHRADMAEYRRTCHRAAQVVAASSDEDLQKTWVVAWSHFLIAPDGLDDYSNLITFMRRFLDRRPNDTYCRFSLGAFLYRQGKYEEARPLIEESLKPGVNGQGQHAYGRIVLAMIAAKENRLDDAKQLFAEGKNRWYSEIYYNWRFQLVNQTLCQEAERVIAAQTPDTK